jgi:hypothetical protein
MCKHLVGRGEKFSDDTPSKRKKNIVYNLVGGWTRAIVGIDGPCMALMAVAQAYITDDGARE